jgi:hypothetical protein
MNALLLKEKGGVNAGYGPAEVMQSIDATLKAPKVDDSPEPLM